MRIAVLSDIHANQQALSAVAKDLETQRVEEVWCLGDVVGYGANPVECLEWVEKHAAIIIKGNHDHAVASGEMSWFNPQAARAARAHAQMLQPPDRSRIYSWPERERRRVGDVDVHIVHGSPDDPLHEYVRPSDAPLIVRRWEGRGDLVVMGHTHVPFFARPDSRVRGPRATEDAPVPTPSQRWRGIGFHENLEMPILGTFPALLNPGSVGQPRDGDPRSSYAVVDFDAREVSLRRVAYDIEAAAHAIVEAGLDPTLAHRLLRGR